MFMLDVPSLATQPIHLLDDTPENGFSVPFPLSEHLREETPALRDLPPTSWSEEQLPEFDDHYGLLTPEQVVVVRSYGDDGDDQVLGELRPRFIIMFDPNQDFVRRIEVRGYQYWLGSWEDLTDPMLCFLKVYKSSNPGLAVRVYFMIYHLSTEEHKYLSGQRREKDAFERLIKERGVSLGGLCGRGYVSSAYKFHSPCSYPSMMTRVLTAPRSSSPSAAVSAAVKRRSKLSLRG